MTAWMWYVAFYASAIAAILGSLLVFISWFDVIWDYLENLNRPTNRPPLLVRQSGHYFGVGVFCACVCAGTLYLSSRLHYHPDVAMWLVLPGALATTQALLILLGITFVKSISVIAVLYRGVLRRWWREAKRRAIGPSARLSYGPSRGPRGRTIDPDVREDQRNGKHWKAR